MNSPFRSKLRNNLGLYVITAASEGRSHVDVARAAVEGGASVIQYRDKSSTNREMYEQAEEIRRLTEQAGVTFIINDRVDIALAVGADGVHLGDDDFPIHVTRRMLGDGFIIGISTTCVDEAIAANEAGADYIGVGPVYPTTTKACAVNEIGTDGLLAIKEAVTGLPTVAIAGIGIDNIDEVIAANPDGIAVVSAVASAPDMAGAARGLAERIQRAKR